MWPFTNFLHTGHFTRAGAHCGQLTIWPHGKNMTSARLSRHILQTWLSFSLWFSSRRFSKGSKIKHDLKIIVIVIITHAIYLTILVTVHNGNCLILFYSKIFTSHFILYFAEKSKMFVDIIKRWYENRANQYTVIYSYHHNH